MTNTTQYYKAYYMMTSKCNLACSYCVLENAPYQLKQELSLSQKMELIGHLYHNLRFRSLTLSGGEALVIGKNNPSDFMSLLAYLKQFKSKSKENNLQIHLYTNGLKLSENVADAMNGIIDEVSITIDSRNKDILLKIGRNRKKDDDYFTNTLTVCKILSDRGIRIKLHTVISTVNYHQIGAEVKEIYEELLNVRVNIDNWKFYQYMTYDVDSVDKKHRISNEDFLEKEIEIKSNLTGYDLKLHFKGNTEMNESLFNILHYGNAQYMIHGDSWTSSKRTENLMNYGSMEELFQKNNVSVDLFNKYHSFNPHSL